MGWWSELGRVGDEAEGTKFASAFEGLASGPRASFSFEDQEGIPVDGSSKAARNSSPFTLRLIPPSLVDIDASLLSEGATANVDQYQQAGSSMSSNEAAATSVRGAYGISSVANSTTVANTLNQQIAAGQYLNTASGNQIRTTLTDSMTAMDIAAQVVQILATPPLTLLVNPNSMAIQYQGIQSYQERGREGFIFQRWGEQQPSIKFSGRTGAFIAGEAGGGGILGASVQVFEEEGTTSTATGVQFASKRNSAAFQNFQALYQIYRNNGYIYDRIAGTEAHHAIGAVAIDYDQWTYVGHIESFEYAYSADASHSLEWSMEFIVGVMYDTAQATYAVLPLTAPIPNPTDPGGGGAGSVGARGNVAGGWFNVSGAEDSTSVFSGWGEEFGIPPIPDEEPAPPLGTTEGVAVTNPDGTPTLLNPNLSDG
jgi:hypothetical protein